MPNEASSATVVGGEELIVMIRVDVLKNYKIHRQWELRKPSHLFCLVGHFINNGKDDLRDVFIKFTDGADTEVAHKQGGRIRIQVILIDCKNRWNSILVVASNVPCTQLCALPYIS